MTFWCFCFQKTTPSCVYAMVVISFDLISCFYVATSYILVYQDAKRMVVSDQKDNENKIMQVSMSIDQFE